MFRISKDKDSSTIELVILAAAIGVLGAFASQLFLFLIEFCTDTFLVQIAQYQPPSTVSEGNISEWIGSHGLYLIPLVTTLGGFLSGLLVFKFAPEAKGHGTDAAIRSYHRQGGSIRGRVPIVKVLASALTIGSGGSAGREGPVAQITAGVGSYLSKKLNLSVPSRRVIMLAGMSAGISASFKSPLGASIFAVEVLYSSLEFENGVLAICIVASSVAYAVNGFFSGWTPIFHIPEGLAFHRATDLLWYAVLGIVCGGFASILPRIFYGTERFFDRLALPQYVKPAVGGMCVGLIAIFIPEILGGGYGWIEKAINAELGIGIVFTLALAKIVSLSLTIGSGGSGGVFAPALYIGTMVGSGLALIIDSFLPVELGGPDPHAMAIVGMAALFAGAARVPIASLVIMAELTGGYGLIVPTMLAVVFSFMIEMGITSRFFSSFPSLYQAQVFSRAESPTHQQEYVELGLNILKGKDLITTTPLSSPALTKLLKHSKPIPLGSGGQSLYTIFVSQDSSVIGKQVRDVRFVDKILIAAIIRDDESITPRGNTVIEEKDQLIVICNEDDYEQLRLEVIEPAPRQTEEPSL